MWRRRRRLVGDGIGEEVRKWRMGVGVDEWCSSCDGGRWWWIGLRGLFSRLEGGGTDGLFGLWVDRIDLDGLDRNAIDLGYGKPPGQAFTTFLVLTTRWLFRLPSPTSFFFR